jgi:pyruvate/2-oxoglutarate dehydrogenase complex dihydrolipoamide dehydrogenase (E3) component
VSEDEPYDVLIIGGGQAGVPLAHALAKAGKRVALAERERLGGSCVNFGCTPTKAVIASARVAQLARRAFEFGLTISKVEVNFPAVLERAKGIATQSRAALRQGMQHSDNPMLLRGHARFVGRKGRLFRLRVDRRKVTAGQVVLNTGTRSFFPRILGLNAADALILHAGNWLEKPDLPTHLAVLGGSYTGLEMAQFYRRMGSRVTVVDQGAQVTQREDPDVALALQQLLESEDIAFRLNARLTKVLRRSGRLVLTLREKGKLSRLEASHLFVAAGRKPNTDDLGLRRVGVKVSKEGIVRTDRRLATSVRGVWAAGDIRGGPMFTHTAWDDYRVLLSQMIGNRSRTTDRIVPYAIYTDPQLGRVGMTETEARRGKRKILVGRFEMRKNGKAREIGEPEGFVKVIVDARTKRILGASVLGAEGAELVHLLIDLMNAGAPCTVIRDGVYIHPTLAEAIQSAVSAVR